MKLFPFLLTIIFLASCSTVHYSEQDLIKMELGRSKAIEFHDSAALKKMYADDFSGVATGGVVVNKAILMRIFSRHTNDLIFVNDDHKVRFINKKTAVLTGRLTSKDRNNHIIGVSRYSHVLNYTDKRWQIIYGQGTVIPQPDADTVYVTINLMPEFWKFWDQSGGMDQSAKLKSFRETVIEKDKEIYNLLPTDITDALLTGYFDNITPVIPIMRQLSEKFPKWIAESWKRFSGKFPDIKGTSLILMPSLGTFDGMSRRFGDRKVLLFGIDQMARTSGGEINFAPQIQHEIFHFYHAQVTPSTLESRELYLRLWQEGLAVYVSKILNPQATDLEIFLSTTLRAEATPIVPKLAKELREKLHSTSAGDDREFFNSTTSRKDVPAKSGYFVGYLVAEELDKQYNLAELSRLQERKLLEEIEQALLRFEPK